MNTMESKICEKCGDFFTIKIGSKIEECLDCKNERESDKMERLPTKKEVTERLQNAIDELNKYAYGRIYINAGYAHDLIVVEANNNTSHNIGRAEYRPEPKPPEKDLCVIVVSGFDEVNVSIAFSRGNLSDNGKLCVSRLLGGAIEDFYFKWYCPSTGQKSTNWQDEWTPEEFRK